MKKTHWFRNTLITLIVCGLAGLAVALILFNANPGRTGAMSTIEFAFEGAAEGRAPNGLRYDLSALTSDDVLNAALEETGLSEKYSAEQLRANLLASGVYPEDIVRQMTGYESVLTGDAGRVAAADYHATLYNVALYNDFDKNIAQKDLEALLTAVMQKFRERFERTYAVTVDRVATTDTIAGYDYPQQLELLESRMRSYETYAQQMARENPDFLLEGEGFADVAVKFSTLRTSDLERLNGQVIINALSRDRERIASQYENQIRILNISLKELDQEVKDLKALIAKYDRDDIIYVSTTGSLQKVSGNTETYDALVASQKRAENDIAAKTKEKEQLELKLADLSGGAAQAGAEGEDPEAEPVAPVSEEDREAQQAAVERGIAAAIRKLNSYTEQFRSMLTAYSQREMNDGTVAVTPVKYKAPKILSGAFAVQLVKTAGPFCALGFMACLILLIISRMKEEKRKDGKA